MPCTFDHDTPAGRRPDAERDPLVGRLLDGRYLIEQRIATGGFGAVYRARTDSGESIALKILHPRLARDPRMVARFRREGATLTTLRDPHTVTTLAVGETADGLRYIAMELLSGESLQDHLHRAGALPWQAAAAIARAVCSSLGEAHALGAVHRDLKPANIHVETRGGSVQAVKVIDFGVVKIARGSAIDDGNDLTYAGHMIGTYDYMSPEQLLGAPCTGASDLYSLGVVLYEMLTGRRPYPRVTSPAAMAAALVTQTPMPPSVSAAIPPELDRIVMRCLERDPLARFASIVELAHELDRLLAVRVAPHDEITVQHPVWPTLPGGRTWSGATAGMPAEPAELADDPPWIGPGDPSPLSPWTLPMVGAFGDASAPSPSAMGSGARTLPGVGVPVLPERRSAGELAAPDRPLAPRVPTAGASRAALPPRLPPARGGLPVAPSSRDRLWSLAAILAITTAGVIAVLRLAG